MPSDANISIAIWFCVNGEPKTAPIVLYVPPDGKVPDIAILLSIHPGLAPWAPLSAGDIIPWRPREPFKLGRAGYGMFVSRLKEHGDRYDQWCEDLTEFVHLPVSQLVPSPSPHPREAKTPVLIAQITTVPSATAGESTTGNGKNDEDDDVGELVKRFKFILANPADRPTPSAGSRPRNYRLYQDGLAPIADGRHGRNDPLLAPPIEIYHSVFASFKSDASDASKLPPPDIIRKTAKLMTAASEISVDEAIRQDSPRDLLSTVLERPIAQMVNRNRTSADHIISHPVLTVLGIAALGIVEEKSELGSSSEGSVQGSFSYIEHWADNSQKKLRDACFCPSFVISIAGPWIVICGAIFTSHAIVQRLTDYIWIGKGRAIDDVQTIRVARVLNALNNALSSLASYYDDLQPPCDRMTRFFPLATSYNSDGNLVTFRYLRMLKGIDPSCVTFLATIVGRKGEDGQQIVVKFVERYGVAAHTLLAHKNWAPKLLYHGHIWDTPTKQTGCGPRQMVVMEYVKGKSLTQYDSLPASVQATVLKAVEHLAAHDMVHGDIRRPNIIVQEEEGDSDHDDGEDCGEGTRVKIIDFDWAGKQGEVRYPLYLSSGIAWAEGVDDYELIDASHDIDMARRLT